MAGSVPVLNTFTTTPQLRAVAKKLKHLNTTSQHFPIKKITPAPAIKAKTPLLAATTLSAPHATQAHTTAPATHLAQTNTGSLSPLYVPTTAPTHHEKQHSSRARAHLSTVPLSVYASSLPHVSITVSDDPLDLSLCTRTSACPASQRTSPTKALSRRMSSPADISSDNTLRVPGTTLCCAHSVLPARVSVCDPIALSRSVEDPVPVGKALFDLVPQTFWPVTSIQTPPPLGYYSHEKQGFSVDSPLPVDHIPPPTCVDAQPSSSHETQTGVEDKTMKITAGTTTTVQLHTETLILSDPCSGCVEQCSSVPEVQRTSMPSTATNPRATSKSTAAKPSMFSWLFPLFLFGPDAQPPQSTAPETPAIAVLPATIDRTPGQLETSVQTCGNNNSESLISEHSVSNQTSPSSSQPLSTLHKPVPGTQSHQQDGQACLPLSVSVLSSLFS